MERSRDGMNYMFQLLYRYRLQWKTKKARQESDIWKKGLESDTHLVQVKSDLCCADPLDACSSNAEVLPWNSDYRVSLTSFRRTPSNHITAYTMTTPSQLSSLIILTSLIL